jgi:hypothetical protein
MKGQKGQDAMNASENEKIEVQIAEPQEAKPAPKKAAPRKSGKIKKATGSGDPVTLGELAERYLEHLEADGKSHGTLFSYGIELRTATKALGAETLIDLPWGFRTAKIARMRKDVRHAEKETTRVHPRAEGRRGPHGP